MLLNPAVGFIGLGVMGAPMATNLLAKGFCPLHIYDIDSLRLAPLKSKGAIVENSVQAIAANTDIVLTSLPGPAEVEAVATASNGLLANLQSGAVWIDLSTNDQESGHKLHSMAESRGIRFLDAPVSGGDEGAIAGSLTVMVGGEEETFQKMAPVLRAIGKNVLHVGPAGAGYAAKIAQVILCYLHTLTLGEALMLGIAGKVDPSTMLWILQHSAGQSYATDRYGPPILDGSFDPSFTLGLAYKDLRLATHMANSLELELPMTQLTTDTYRQAADTLGADTNHLEVVRLLERTNQMRLRASSNPPCHEDTYS